MGRGPEDPFQILSSINRYCCAVSTKHNIPKMAPGCMHGFLVALCYAFLLSPVHGQLNESFTYTSLAEAFPSLNSLETNPPNGSPPVGRQKFSRCCLQAVNESYIIRNGKIRINPDGKSRYIELLPSNLNATQFPCGAKFAGDDDGAAEVRVPYSWCRQNCGGWQRSTGTELSEWVQPLVGFILPSAVFCLHVSENISINCSRFH